MKRLPASYSLTHASIISQSYFAKMADQQPPSCPGANNTVYSFDNSRSYSVYCNVSYMDMPKTTAMLTKSSFVDCFNLCESNLPGSYACMGFLWWQASGYPCHGFSTVGTAALGANPGAITFRWTGYDAGAPAQLIPSSLSVVAASTTSWATSPSPI